MKKLLGSLLVGAALLMTACGSSSAGESKQSTEREGYPVTVSNFARAEGAETWTEKDQTFEAAPKRVVATARPAAELLLHLGLKDSIAGVGGVFGTPDKSVEKEFDELNELSTGYIGKEVALSVDPDLVYGRGGLFDNADWGVGTVDSLNEMGMSTYVLASSVTGATFDSVYDDIDDLGKIFSVTDKAEEFKEELKTRQKAVEDKLSGIKENKTFAYLHTSDPAELAVYAANGESFFNDVFTMVKLTNIFQDEKGEVSLETLIETDPDVLIVPNWDDYGAGEAVGSEEMIAGILSNPKLSSMKAVKNKQIYAVDYNYMFGYGYQSLEGMEKLAEEMYPDL